MEPAQGLLTLAGFRREALVSTPTWPAASAALVRQRLPVTGISFAEGVEVAVAETAAQGYGPEAADIVRISPGESWSSPLRYEGFEELLACALGYQAKRLGGVLQPEALAAGVYRHLMEVDDNLSAVKPWSTADGFTGPELTPALYRVRRGTTAIWRGISVWQLLSAMVSRLTLTGSLAGVQLQLDLVGYQRVRDSLINTHATLTAAALNRAPNVLMRHGTFRLAPWSASTPLQASDVLIMTNWQLTIDNRLEAAPGPRTGLYVEEYEKTGVSTITLSLDLARYQDDVGFQRLLAGTPLMADLKHTGPTISGTAYNYQWNVYMPRFFLTEVQADVQGPAAPQYTHQATLVVPVAASAGMPASNHLGPLSLEIVNTVSTHALLD